MREIRHLIAAIALSLIVQACGSAGNTCKTDSDCDPVTEKCYWITRNGQVVRKGCVARCTTDADCDGKPCISNGAFCPGCPSYLLCSEE